MKQYELKATWGVCQVEAVIFAKIITYRSFLANTVARCGSLSFS
ncbi:hypothetical protein THIOSC15_1310003 [uncultured Thiomicrorhabdus sp.]